jgi:hypothetical protein
MKGPEAGLSFGPFAALRVTTFLSVSLTRLPAYPPIRLLLIHSRFRIHPLLCLAGGILYLALDLLALALHLLSGIPGQASNRIANSAFNLLGPALETVLGALGGQILFVGHFYPRSLRRMTCYCYGTRILGDYRKAIRDCDHRIWATLTSAGRGVLSAKWQAAIVPPTARKWGDSVRQRPSFIG